MVIKGYIGFDGAPDFQSVNLRNKLTVPDTRSRHPDLRRIFNYRALQGGRSCLITSGYQRLCPRRGSVSFQNVLRNACPCLTKARCKQDGWYTVQHFANEAIQWKSGAYPRLSSQRRCFGKATIVAPEALIRRGHRGLHDLNLLQTMLRLLLHSAGLATLTSSQDWCLRCPSDRCYQLSDNLWAKHIEKIQM